MGAKLGKTVASVSREIGSVGVERVMAGWSRPHSKLRTAAPLNLVLGAHRHCVAEGGG